MKAFKTCRARVLRADSHFQASAKLWAEFSEGDTYRPIVDVESDGRGTISVVPRGKLRPLFAIQVGEIFYQLRAALDSLVYQASIYDSGQDPPPDHEYLEFPFRSTSAAFNKPNVARKIDPLSPKRRTIVETVQPYNAPNVTSTERDTILALANLNHWARIDRHRRLHFIGSWASPKGGPQFRPPSGVVIRNVVVTSATGHFLEDESKIASFVADGWKPTMQMQANPNLFIDIAINEPDPTGAVTQMILDDAINGVMQAVQVVMERFELSY